MLNFISVQNFFHLELCSHSENLEFVNISFTFKIACYISVLEDNTD